MLVFGDGRSLRTRDGIEVWSVERLHRALAENALWPRAASSSATSSANPESHPYNALPLATPTRPGPSERGTGVEHGEERLADNDRRGVKRRTRRPRPTQKGTGTDPERRDRPTDRP